MNYHFIKPFALAGMLAACCMSVVNAQSARETDDHRRELSEQVASGPQRGPHGGTLRQSGSLQLETVVSQGGVHMFAFDLNDQPLSVERGRGAASLRVEGNAKRYRYDLLPDGKGGLAAPVNLSQLAGHQIEIEIQLVGLPGISSQPLKLREVASVPASQQQLVTASGDQVRPGIYKVTAADEPFIAAQMSCPVMDEPLDAMGGPYKVNAHGRAIYICCPGCAKKIASEPQRYLAILQAQGVQAPVLR